MRVTALLVCAFGCGRIGFDASSDGTTATFGPFSAPQMLSGINSPRRDFAPSISRDQLELYFSSDQAGAEILVYRATRGSTVESFTNSVAVDFGFSYTSEPALSRGGTEIYVTDSGERLLRATRAGTSSAWQDPAIDLGLAGFLGASFGGGDLRLVMHSRVTQEIYESSRPDVSSAWSSAVLFPMAPFSSVYPDLSEDGLEIFIQVGAAPEPESIYTATRLALDAPFGSFTRLDLPGMPPDARIVDPDISADGSTLYFASDAASIGGSIDVWVTTRARQ